LKASRLVLLPLVVLLPIQLVASQEDPPGQIDGGQKGPGSENAEDGQREWDYSRDRGPARWAALDPSYVLARVGGSQSPIDIVRAEVVRADLPELVLDYPPQPLHIINNGHTIEVISTDTATLRFGDHVYALRQVHFHAPSEHTIDGAPAEVEVHFVHADGEGHIAVVAVLFEEGEPEHPDIGELLKIDLLAEPGGELVDEATALDLQKFLPDSLGQYYTYDGSLTTPPATEGVRWFVLEESLHLNRQQIETIDRVYYSNNRPTQPRNARFVLTRGGS
jgi:carbonic anhydrase